MLFVLRGCCPPIVRFLTSKLVADCCVEYSFIRIYYYDEYA